MGGAVSQGIDNDDIINKLKSAAYINSPQVEKAFRLVDRGFYILHEDRCSFAYKDTAWRKGNLHLSAPCIYAQVLEGLKISSGMSFLNLGSGTGYLSTIVGLILGPYGTNHGVEIHSDVIAYAKERLESFMSTSTALDVMDICKPEFFEGNAYLLDENVQKYDRVYCGAALSATSQDLMQNLLKVGGILVVPVGDQLLQIEKSADGYETKSLLPVSFSSMIRPPPEYEDKNVFLPASDLLSLREICRLNIRQLLRDNVEHVNADLNTSLIFKVVNSSSRSTLFRSVNEDMSDDEVEGVPTEQFSDEFLNLVANYPMVRGGHRLFHPGSRISLGILNNMESTVWTEEDDEGYDALNLSPSRSPMIDDEWQEEAPRDANSPSLSAPNNVCSLESSSESGMSSRRTNESNVSSQSSETACKRGRSESSAGEESNAQSSSGSMRSNSKNSDCKALKREKFDSGVGNEADVELAPSSMSSSESDLDQVTDSDSNDIQTLTLHANDLFNFVKQRSTDESGDGYRKGELISRRHQGRSRVMATHIKRKYSDLMLTRIKKLPLPWLLKVYVNYDRSL